MRFALKIEENKAQSTEQATWQNDGGDSGGGGGGNDDGCVVTHAPMLLVARRINAICNIFTAT
jgi:hypothetical protein